MQMIRIALVAMALSFAGLAVEAASGKVIKVLPQYLDSEGRHALSPSLYERDAYQAVLRKDPSKRAGMQFNVQWKARGVDSSNLKIRIELRTSKTPAGKLFFLEQPVKRSHWFTTWSALKMDEKQYEEMGDLVAWHATLWSGDQLVAELKSFLW